MKLYLRRFYLLALCLVPNMAWSQESSTETRWYVFQSDQYFQCAGFLWSASEVIERKHPEFANKTKEASIDLTARALATFKKEFPQAQDWDFIGLHAKLYLEKYKEIWRRELQKKNYETIKNQTVACQEFLPDFEEVEELEDFIPSLGI